MRIILWPSMPHLSDDIYRFIWDGKLLWAGVNPFSYLPIELKELAFPFPGLDEKLYSLLNSPEYFTIYPPICQLIFAASSFPAIEELGTSVIIMRSFFLLSEITTLKVIFSLLKKLNKPKYLWLIYAFNPLIIVELTGNLHFEAFMICFLLCSLYFLYEHRIILSAIFMSLSIASKLLPLMFLPLMLTLLNTKKLIIYYIICGLSLVILFLPFISMDMVYGFQNSMGLYFQKFEFNASIYYLLRWLGFQSTGYNLIHKIGPIMGLITLLGILYLSYGIKNREELPSYMLLAFSLYLFTATTIHPWYVSLPLALCIFGHFRFPIIWSFLICLTYINYSYLPYKENLWLVSLEYLLVYGYFAYEGITRTDSKNFTLKKG